MLTDSFELSEAQILSQQAHEIAELKAEIARLKRGPEKPAPVVPSKASAPISKMDVSTKEGLVSCMRDIIHAFESEGNIKPGAMKHFQAFKDVADAVESGDKEKLNQIPIGMTPEEFEETISAC
mmetsp:Transcript_34159/g.56563  ORF Transcript_34159/g.56563 Transcript_34159/m.56563 type:complete len:124 (-) Transcript_34159:417-788(-)|eukprot:CAMPEP_0119304862 /NCGR_PEP_ID=MMETSP1333-20130426/5981_1 /TAXON_ID=418940 /ORGANISM="Scyphosphaera apsteinii, Strain RCC1455" /LENGTH=123 /DNA_ID=CAMNT_0007307815 /DNA_START=251 /DNA_END=622 /DNA_ORIENTATION=+